MQWSDIERFMKGTYDAAMNGKINFSSASIIRPNNTTAYAANDVISTAAGEVLVFDNITKDHGSGFIVSGARARFDIASLPSGMSGFRLHIYNSAPTAIADNSAYNLPSSDAAKYIGYITISPPLDLGETLWSQDDNLNFSGKLANNSLALYGIFETLSAFTPSGLTQHIIMLNSIGV